MKSASLPSPIGLNVIVLALLIAAIVFIAVTEKKVPVLSNPRAAMTAVLVLGMVMCTAVSGEWPPFSSGHIRLPFLVTCSAL
jgi:uncharacterized membrane protein (UPF0182 family)